MRMSRRQHRRTRYLDPTTPFITDQHNMRGTGKSTAKDPEDYEDQFLHQTIGSSRIRSHSTKYGSHKIHRHHQFAAGAPSSSLPSAASSAPGAAGTTASSVSAYLENLPSVNLGTTLPPRPPRPPGGLLGISNGRGMGYGRSLGSSYDSPLTIHGSFNGHVRSCANLYGGRNQSSGLLPVKPSSAYHRPSMSVFPIQKALEIAMKESRLLAAASSRGGSGPSGTGMSSGTTFVRELRRARHARGAIITEHGPTPDISLDEDEDEDVQAEDADHDARATQDHSVNSNSGSDDWHMHGQGDIRIQRPAVVSFDAKTHYPGIAYLPHTLSHHPGLLSMSSPGSLRNVPSTRVWDQLSESTMPSSPPLASASSVSSASSPSSSSSSIGHASLESLFVSSSSPRAPYQSHFSPVLSSSSIFTSTHTLFPNGPSISHSGPDPPTHSAVHAVRELLDSYPAPSPYCVDDKKRSPLHFAAASGDLELVEFLLERGVRPDCGRDIAGNMPLHLAIISNRIDVVAALLKAGADMTLASPMTHKTPLDLAESRLSYLLSKAQDSVKQSRSSGSTSSMTLDLHNSQIATLSSFHAPPAQSPALLYQIRGIVNLLRPYVVRQQKLQHGERQVERQKERSWERADKYMRQHHHHRQDQAGGSSSSGLWRVDPHSDDNFGDMEDEDEDDEEDDDHMDTEDRRRPAQKRFSAVDGDGDMELNDDDDDDVDRGRTSHSMKSKKITRRPGRRMDADETEEALESLMNGLSLLEASRRQLERQQQHPEQQSQPSQQQQQQQQQAQLRGRISDIADGNLADSELDPRSEQEVEEALPDLLEQVQQVLEAIKLNEAS